MAFGITRKELAEWKRKVNNGEIAFITHYWYDPRYPDCKTVTKAGSSDLALLAKWGRHHGLDPKWIHHRKDGFSHFDLLGNIQRRILQAEGQYAQLQRFL